ncbi:hypothetical protein HDU86_000971 [Geranomyces michiganensis]|nr:hypothetical protein HDU86_000971 [Geranomyces michiganensis]
MSTPSLPAAALSAESAKHQQQSQLQHEKPTALDTPCARWLKLRNRYKSPEYEEALKDLVYDIADHLGDFGYPSEIDRQVFCRQLEANKAEWQHYAANWAVLLNPRQNLPGIGATGMCLFDEIEEMMGEPPRILPKSYVAPVFIIFHPLKAAKIAWSNQAKSAPKKTPGHYKYEHLD